MKIVTASYLFPMTHERGASRVLMPRGALLIDNGRIVDVAPIDELTHTHPHLPVETHAGCVLMPGLVNAHLHLDLTGYPREAYTERSSYSRGLLGQHRYKSELSDVLLRDAIKHGLSESIAAGTTLIGDMSSVSGAVLSEVRACGIRAVLFPEIAVFDHEMGQDLYENALALIDQAEDWQKHDTEEARRIRMGVGPYAPFTLSRQMLRMIAGHATAAGVPLQIHLAETFHEMEFFFDSKGDIAENLFPQMGWGEELPVPRQRTPVAYLEDIDFLKARPILASSVHLGVSDLDRLKVCEAAIVHCPRSNRYLLQGCLSLRTCLDLGIPVGLGTDSHATVETLSMWDEMRACFAMHQALGPQHALSVREVFELATFGGARALGLLSETGSLQIGKSADYIAVSLGNKASQRDAESASDDKILTCLLEETGPGQIVTVAVLGEALVSPARGGSARAHLPSESEPDMNNQIDEVPLLH